MRKRQNGHENQADGLTGAYDTLIGIASAGKPLDTILEAASRLLRCGLAYVAASGDVACISADDADFHEKARFLPLIELQRLYNVSPNREEEDRVGHLVVQHLSPATERFLAPLQLAVQVYFNLRNTKSKRILQYAEKFLDKLPDDVETHDLDHYFRIMKIDFTVGIQVIAGTIPAEADTEKGFHFFERLDARLRNFSRKYISRISENPGRQFVAAVSPQNSPDLKALAQNLIEICSHEAARHYGENEPEVRIALGAARKNHLEIRECCREAVTALRLSSYIAPARFISSWDDLGAYKLISHIANDAYARFFCGETLRGLVVSKSRENAELMETLVSLDESNWNLREVSRKMFYHHNTIKHRYAKIQDILESDLSDAETRFRISLALRILRCLPGEAD
jgi:Regulator of polyketide synthase expression